MVERIPDLPDNVLGFKAKGQVTVADYESTLIPAIKDLLARHERARLLYHLGDDYTGFEAKVMWEDTKIGMRHLRACERFAVVTDVEWIHAAVKVFRLAMLGHLRVFHNNELAVARAWLCE